MLRPDPDSTPAINAKACLWRAEPTGSEGHPVFFEEVHLHVGGQAASHLASIVGPFVLADLPVVMWFPDVLPDPADPLLRLATRSWWTPARSAPDPGAIGHSYRTLLELANHQPVVDLSWVRLQPWRELLAGLFEPEHSRPFLQGVRSASVSGQARAAAHARRLAHVPAGPARPRARAGRRQARRHHSGGRLPGRRGQVPGQTGRRRPGPSGRKPSLSNGISHRQALPLPDDSLTSALSRRVSNLQADRVWERALAAAAALAS